MKCKYCGSEVAEGLRFCPACGQKTEPTAPIDISKIEIKKPEPEQKIKPEPEQRIIPAPKVVETVKEPQKVAAGKNRMVFLQLGVIIFIVLIGLLMILAMAGVFNDQKRPYNYNVTTINKTTTTGTKKPAATPKPTVKPTEAPAPAGSNVNDDLQRFVSGESSHSFTLSVGEYVTPQASIWNGKIDNTDSTVVSVSSDGTVTALKAGTATITYHGGSLQQSYTIVVK